MMKEIVNVRQVQGDPRRRWFADEYFDLIVWIGAEDSVEGFQLCYDKGREQRALTWHITGAYSHDRIDDGEDHPLRYKATPIVVADGIFDAAGIRERFREASGSIPDEFNQIVCDAIDSIAGKRRFNE